MKAANPPPELVSHHIADRFLRLTFLTTPASPQGLNVSNAIPPRNHLETYLTPSCGAFATPHINNIMAITVPIEPRSKARSPLPTSRRRAPTAADEVKPEGTVPPQTTFNFFGLSRELRDMVYDFSLTFKRKIRSQHGARLRGRMVAEAPLLLVGKQFSREYFERAQYHTCLIIVDRPEFHGDTFKIPRALSYVRNVELFLAIACDSPDHFTDQCRVVKEVRMHRKWIVDLCQKMRRLESISIKLITDPHQHIEACEAKLLELQHKLTNFEELKKLAVYHCDYAGKETGWSFASKRTLVMEWSAKDGELHRVEAPNASPEVEKGASSESK
ncbi:hypothetical protein LTR35_012947 [Friedmanniomyces endolithicus]|uniref:Uncharacterized protein n=1 Tax=Friedmanniomyces endolithicus TaxID=329885 RepID=A0AAN6FM74_9PEZI|nr:hypothetical protein LTR35_012947 [Friedmanniomyces endolithicus]KAK0285506.1 hypothetical protein LTS00_010867 [Friedmanniomyces endolithicus]KAK0319178.1 hypothetical protein LTR82_009942 [Friedmanniomyces endolithicus]KAK0977833.1 hypothetical protein LTR54_016071 [Friedmanniomyces endolithicus]